MAAATKVAPRQPHSFSIKGSRTPASAKPSGTPVCLTEKTKLYHSRGTRCVRMCVEAGLIGPCATPMKATAATVATMAAEALSAKPMAAMSRAPWQTRTAPSRMIGPALPSATEAAIA